MSRDLIMRFLTATGARAHASLQRGTRSIKMCRQFSYVTLFGGILLGLAGVGMHFYRIPVAHAQQNACPWTDNTGFGAYWPKPYPVAVTVNFNPALDPNLENNINGASNPGTRWAAFQQAVNDWQTKVLNNLGGAGQTPITLTPQQDLTQVTIWGVDQGMQMCTDNSNPMLGNVNVFQVTRHLGNTVNSTSTGDNPGNVNTYPNGNVLGPGWIYLQAQMTSQDDGFEQILGLTYPTIANGDLTAPIDIGWMTHIKGPGGTCSPIPWNYFAAPLLPPNGSTDFYSVMIHELGHLLGLGHLPPNPLKNNAMQSSLPTGTRYEVGAAGDPEVTCLQCLYYGIGCPQAQGDTNSPTLTQWSVFVMGLGLIGVSLWRMRRRGGEGAL
jgi:hypothetical protein